MALDERYHQEWQHISRHVRLLFQEHCARCGKDCSQSQDQSSQLQVHHIDENPGNNAMENLVPLCSVCHLQIEKEARLHAPHHEQQGELFDDHTYFSAMSQIREEALKRLKSNTSETSDEEFEQWELEAQQGW